MAYKEIYYKQIEREGHEYRLSILKRNTTQTAKEIGDLVSLSLEMTGGTDDVNAPIVKTYCYFSMVDSRDKRSTSSIKYGAWEEFYTNDATLYMVEVYEDEVLRWKGYITPDSWEEDLSYRGIVTITARDNLGYLQEMEFNSEERFLSLNQIVTYCIQQIGQNVGFSEKLGSTLAESGTLSKEITQVKFNTELWKDKTWYDALEGSLESLGLVLRYIDNAMFVVCSMDEQASAMVDYSRKSKLAVFINNSGHRSLVASYKKITDTIRYDFEGEKSITNLTNHSLRRPNFGASRVLIGSGVEMMNAEGTFPIPVDSFNANQYLYKNIFMPPKTKMQITFNGAGSRFFVPTSALNNMVTWSSLAMQYKYAIVWMGATSTKYYTGTSTNDGQSVWQTTPVYFTETAEASSSSVDSISYTELGKTFNTPNEEGVLQIRFYAIQGTFYNDWGLINNLQYNTTSNEVVESHTAKLVNTMDNAGNILAERTSEIGQYVGDSCLAPLCLNAFVLGNDEGGYQGVTGWRFSDDETTRFSTFWELMHRWLFCFFSKPNNVLTGDIIDWTDDDPHFSDVYTYNGKSYILAGGRLNLINGHMEGVTLREFVKYDDLYEDYAIDSIEVHVGSEVGQVSRDQSGNLVISYDINDSDEIEFEFLTSGGFRQPKVTAKITDSDGGKTSVVLLNASTAEYVNGKTTYYSCVVAVDFFKKGYRSGDASIEVSAAYPSGDEGGASWDEIALSGDKKIILRVK